MSELDGQSEIAIEARRKAIASAGSALRATMLALIETEVPAEVLTETAEHLESIAARLSSARRSADQLASVDDLTHGIQMFSPVVGAGNPQALPLKFEQTADGVEAEVSFDRRFEGPPGHVHGGHIALMLDEVLAQAMINSERWGLTARLSVDYMKAIQMGASVTCHARVSESHGRRTVVTGGIKSPDGLVSYATAQAVFVSPRAVHHDQYFGRIVDSNGNQASARLETPKQKDRKVLHDGEIGRERLARPR